MKSRAASSILAAPKFGERTRQHRPARAASSRALAARLTVESREPRQFWRCRPGHSLKMTGDTGGIVVFGFARRIEIASVAALPAITIPRAECRGDARDPLRPAVTITGAPRFQCHGKRIGAHRHSKISWSRHRSCRLRSPGSCRPATGNHPPTKRLALRFGPCVAPRCTSEDHYREPSSGRSCRRQLPDK